VRCIIKELILNQFYVFDNEHSYYIFKVNEYLGWDKYLLYVYKSNNIIFDEEILFHISYNDYNYCRRLTKEEVMAKLLWMKLN
jgi:hypothetical protein